VSLRGPETPDERQRTLIDLTAGAIKTILPGSSAPEELDADRNHLKRS
jgi:hypothetical protein